MVCSKIEGLTAGSYRALQTPPPPAAKFASQGDAPLRTDTQIKFQYFPLSGSSML